MARSTRRTHEAEGERPALEWLCYSPDDYDSHLSHPHHHHLLLLVKRERLPWWSHTHTRVTVRTPATHLNWIEDTPIQTRSRTETTFASLFHSSLAKRTKQKEKAEGVVLGVVVLLLLVVKVEVGVQPTPPPPSSLIHHHHQRSVEVAEKEKVVVEKTGTESGMVTKTPQRWRWCSYSTVEAKLAPQFAMGKEKWEQETNVVLVPSTLGETWKAAEVLLEAVEEEERDSNDDAHDEWSWW